MIFINMNRQKFNSCDKSSFMCSQPLNMVDKEFQNAISLSLY